MTSGITFLVAARRAEIRELEQLAVTSEWVSQIGELVHGLQKERGLANVWLGAPSERLAAQRSQQVAQSQACEQQVRERFDALDVAPATDAGLRNGARLYSRIAVALHALDGLDGLGGLRERIAARAITPESSTAAYVRVIATLLAVVFQAADNAGDPAISRELVALFQFMQGKEFAGQERALGVVAFGQPRGEAVLAARLAQWQHLIEQQERCFEVFADFADDAVLAAWRGQPPALMVPIERLRRIGASRAAPGRADSPPESPLKILCENKAIARLRSARLYPALDAPVAQLDRAFPSEAGRKLPR